MNIFVFDIETIPDLINGRKIYGLEGLNDAETATALATLRRQGTNGSEFMPLHLQQIVAISVLLRTPTALKIWSLGEIHAGEPEILERFFAGIDKFEPTLVSWNGGGFDLPVIHYRALLHGVRSPRYWDTGEDDQRFRFNNYLNRYHQRHTDLLDILASYNQRAYAPLDEIAIMLDLPGKMGMHGSKVLTQYQQGNIAGIRNYCETDVLNTYLVYLRFEYIRGKLNSTTYHDELETLKVTLQQSPHAHHQEFLQNLK